MPRLPRLCTVQAPQLRTLLETASDADLLKALDKAPDNKGKKAKRVLEPDAGALRALLDCINQAHSLAFSERVEPWMLHAQAGEHEVLHLLAQTANTGSLRLLTALLRLMPTKLPCALLQLTLPLTPS